MGSRVTSDGQVTIPEELREQLGIRAGDEVSWDQTPDGKLVCSKVVGGVGAERRQNERGEAIDEDALRAARRQRLAAALEEWKGAAGPLGLSVDAYVEEMRGR